jgi:hypothetical protein
MKLILSFAIGCCCVLSTAAQTVGIGTPNATRAKLEVVGAVDYTTAIFGGDGPGISLQRNNPGIGFNAYYNGGHKYLSYGYGAHQFLDAASGNMAINIYGYGAPGSSVFSSRRAMLLINDGRVVFGQTSGQAASLNVGKDDGSEASAYFFGTNYHSVFHSGFAEHTYIRAGKDGGIVFINDIPNAKTALNGPVGIGTATPATPLEIRMTEANRGLLLSEPVNGNTWGLSVRSDDPDFHLASNGVYRGYFDRTDASYHHLSDRRIKTAIVPLQDILPRVMKLKPVQYEMSELNPQHLRSIGFVAQDVVPFFPQVVGIQKGVVKGYSGIADLHMVNYRSFSVLAIQAIREQDAILKSQALKLAELEKELATLEQSL